MGFLSGLGEFAGGVSEGISKEAQDRARREQAAAAKAERLSKEAQEQRDEIDRIEQAKVYGAEYVPKVVEKPTLKGDISKAAGVLASLFTKKDVDATARASGVLPELPAVGLPEEPAKRGMAIPAAAPTPARAADQTNLQLPRHIPTEPGQDVGLSNLKAPDYSEATRAQPATPSAALAPSPASIAELAKGPPGYTPPTEVAVFGTRGEETRPANAIDRMLRSSQAHFKAGNVKEGTAAYEAYANMVAARKLGMIPTMRTSDLAQLWQEGTGRRPTVTRNEKGLWTIVDDGETVAKDATDGDVQRTIGTFMNENPDVVAKIANASNEARSARMELEGKLEGYSATAAQARATAGSTTQQTGQRVTDEQRKTNYFNNVQKFKPRGSTLLDPNGAAEMAREAEQFDGKNIMVTEGGGVDAEGNVIPKTSYNLYQRRQELERQEWAGNPYVANKIMKVVPVPVSEKFPFGKGFLVASAEGPAKDRVYPNLESAITAAGTTFPDPVAGGKLVAASHKPKPVAAPAAAAPGPKPAAGPKPKESGLPEKPLTPQQRAAATIAKVKADQAAAKAAVAQAAKDDAAATKDEDAEIKGLRTEVFELDKAASKAKGDEKFDFLRQKDPLNKRIRELERAQRVRRAKGRPVEAAPMGAF